MQCSRCNREAMFNIQGHYLCLEHRTMLVNSYQETQRNSMAMMNYLRDNIHETMGVPPPTARIQIHELAVVNHNPQTFNNISVKDSVIGAINTAQVGRIDVAMDRISVNGDDQIANAIKEMTEAVINNNELSENATHELIEKLGFLAEQAALPQKDRQNSVTGMVLKSVGLTLSATANLATVWTQWGATITDFFNNVTP